MPIAGLSVLPGWPLILLPVHEVFPGVDHRSGPACSIVFEAEPADPGIMRRHPRRPTEPLFDHRTVRLSLLQGLGMLAGVMGVLAWALLSGQSEADARVLAMATLVIADRGSTLTKRSGRVPMLAALRSLNPWLRLVMGGASATLVGVVLMPVLRGLFHFGALHPYDLLVVGAASAVTLLWSDGLKLSRLRHAGRHA